MKFKLKRNRMANIVFNPLNQKVKRTLWSCSLENILACDASPTFYNLNTEPFYSRLKDLNFYALAYGGTPPSHGQIKFYANDIYENKPIGNGGYNAQCTANKNAVGKIKFDVSFFPHFINFCNANGYKFFLQPSLDGVQDINELNTLLLWADAKAKFLGLMFQEWSVLGYNDECSKICGDGATVKARQNEYFSGLKTNFPNSYFTSDFNPIEYFSFKQNPKYNGKVVTSDNLCNSYRLYWSEYQWISDGNLAQSNWKDSLDTSIEYFEDSISGIKSYTGKNIALTSNSIEGTAAWSGSFAQADYMVRVYLKMIQLQESIDYALVWRLDPCKIKDKKTTWEYTILKYLGKIFKDGNDLFTFEETDRKGVASLDKNNHGSILISNRTGKAITESISVNGKVLPILSTTALNFSDYYSTTATEESTSSGFSVALLTV